MSDATAGESTAASVPVGVPGVQVTVVVVGAEYAGARYVMVTVDEGAAFEGGIVMGPTVCVEMPLPEQEYVKANPPVWTLVVYCSDTDAPASSVVCDR